MFSKHRGVLIGAALATLLAIVIPAWGQGLYYREAERDGKIYAFNLSKEFETFQKGTPLTKPIERLGWGPKGETVVFDSFEALNLFAFKHGKSPETPPPPPQPEVKKPEVKPEVKKEEPKKDEPKPIRFSGYVFGDVYFFPQSNVAKFDDQSGLWFRRAYFTVDRDLGTAWTTRFRLEVNSPSLQQAQDSLRPYVKDAYLRWTRGAHNVFIGISPSPTWELIEAFWGYRHVEKTPLDLHNWASSRDTGLAAKGTLDKAKKFGYHVMVGSGTGIRNETNREKRFYLALSARPSKSGVFEAYSDVESRPGDTGIRTLQAFGGYEGSSAKLGLQYARQTRQQGLGKDDLDLDLLSVFATGKINPKTLWLARIDRNLDPNPGGAAIAYLPFDPKAKSTLFLAGIDFLPIPSVHFTPNFEVITYDGVNPKPKTDVVARLTFYWTF